MYVGMYTNMILMSNVSFIFRYIEIHDSSDK